MLHAETRVRISHTRTLAVVWALLASLLLLVGQSCAALTTSATTPAAAAVVVANPGQHLAFVQRYAQTSTESLNPDVNSTSESTYSYDVLQAPSGYIATATMLSSKFTMGGSAVPYPLANALLNAPLTVSLDAKAKAVDVLDVDKVLAGIKERLGSTEFEKLSLFFPPDTLKRQAIDDWNALYGRFAGRAATVGSAYPVDRSLELPSGDVMPVQASVKVLSLVTQGSRACAVMSAKYSIASPALLAAYKAFYSQVDMAVSSVSAELDAKYTVDLVNGLVYDSLEKRTTRMKFSDGTPKAKPRDAVSTVTTHRIVELR